MQTIKVPFSKLRRIVHIADVHIRLFKRHEEYKQCFERLYKELQKTSLQDTAIVVAGDIVHSKTELSPEMVDLASSFLSNLADLAPTIVIAGNHDLNMANPNRLDALTPICQNLNHANLHYLRESGVYRLADVDIAVLSLIGDKADWPTSADCTAKTKIALFHGPVYNAKTDVGYTVTDRHVTVETFDGFDFTILGDIHRYQALNDAPIVYASSLIQQNHGENLKGHGWVEWNVKDRTHTFHELQNDYGYYTLTIENGKVPSTADMPKNVRLRLYAGDMDPSDIKKLITKLRTKHNITELAINKFGPKGKIATSPMATSVIDIHNVDHQNKLITEYLTETQPNITQQTLDGVVAINKQLNTEIKNGDAHRRIVWKPISIKFDNLFTYGENNSLNFENMRGVMGLFSPNATGKSSIPDAICFALYDRTPRATKAAHIMNTRATECYVEFVFEIGGVRYVIERTGKKNKKGEVKIDVNFWKLDVNGERVSLNGSERRYTNVEIQNYVGTYEDFVLTALSAQTQTGLFVDRGQSDRKDTLSQFMGLTIFDTLHTLANEKSKEVIGILKQFHKEDFTQALVDAQDAIQEVAEKLVDAEQRLTEATTTVNEYNEIIKEKYALKVPVTIKNTNIDSLNSTKARLETEATQAVTAIAEKTDELDKIRQTLQKARTKLDTEFTNVESSYERLTKLENEKGTLKITLAANEDELARTIAQNARQRDNLKMNPECKVCVEVNAKAVAMIEASTRREKELERIIAEHTLNLKLIDAELDTLDGVRERYDRFQVGKQFVATYEKKESELALEISRLETGQVQLRSTLDDVIRNIKEFYELKDTINKNADLDVEIRNLEHEKSSYTTQVTEIQNEIRSLHSKKALHESTRDGMLRRINEAKELEASNRAYEAYLSAVCRDGLPYKMIADALPHIQVEVNSILSQMTEFTVSLETDGKNVNGKIVYDDDRTWPIELASGMEKFISGLAIRVALMTVSSLPKTNFLIIDEGLGALDADNLSSLFMLFDMLKTQFEFIILISHLDVVRDISDNLIEIKRQNGYSNVVFS